MAIRAIVGRTAHRQVAPKIGVVGVDDILGVGVLRHELGKRIGADIGRGKALSSLVSPLSFFVFQ